MFHNLNDHVRNRSRGNNIRSTFVYRRLMSDVISRLGEVTSQEITGCKRELADTIYSFLCSAFLSLFIYDMYICMIIVTLLSDRLTI